MRRVWHRRIAAALLLPALAWFFWFENNTIVSETFTVRVESLPEEFAGFRIVLLTDLQGKAFGGDNARLCDAVRALEPDLIAVCGDLIDEPAELSVAEPLACALTEIAPTYFVTGNHEWASGAAHALMETLENAGVQVLANEYCVLTRGASRLVIAGVHDPNGPYDMKLPAELMEEIRAAEGDAPVVMLAHRNDSLSMWSELGAELVLSGHGHGGVIRLPFVGGLLGTDRTLFPDYTAGLYELGGTQMVVSRGLGNSGVPFRLFNRPDLPLIILEPG